ncbi:hypothetical protein FTUN_2542 [Frigoriglobus tundricola]|uniref:Protein kinase domain-containing protein n=1 Tax=Frigoriglobus tundricola TaxID=2774151 RepID=A0A6M5YNV5_9BACT|nr:hypothetical protein [Frigoriglobus tundricola]QJW95016.1 hypothetical protein FTUN_2542 [Frigoriglobus tundricola]
MSTLPEGPQDAGTLPVSRPPAWVDPLDVVMAPRVGDFEIVAKLGEGSYGQVFLARQVSLGRHVALKVVRGAPTDDRGEGHLLAGLEHDHIVKVFSAFSDTGTGVHGLCLQYVPGADLGVVIQRVFEGGRGPESGRALLDALDAARRGDAGFDPAALRDREALAADTFAQAVCRIGGAPGRSARVRPRERRAALRHQAGQHPPDALRPAVAGRLQRGVRPHPPRPDAAGHALRRHARVHGPRVPRGDDGPTRRLRRRTVRPLFARRGAVRTGDRHAAAPGHPLHDRRDAPPRRDRHGADGPPAAARGPEDAGLARVPRELAAVLRRCLDPDPARRYQTAAELAAALAGAWSLLAAQRALPAPSGIGRWVVARPAPALFLAGLLPHIVASIAQIEYNAVEVRLDAAQHRVFALLVVAYNLIVYPVCGGTGVYLFRWVVRRLPRLGELSGDEVDHLRQRARRLAWQIAALGALGWLPGGVIFPLVIDLATGPVPWQMYSHFAVSFTLAGLIGVVFSYLGIQYVVFRVLLPRLGNPDTYKPAGMWGEVRPLTAAFGPVVLLASGVPLLGAVLLLTLDDGPMTFGFRLLVVKLIGLGVAGVSMAERVVRRLRQLAAVWQVELSEASA